MSFLSDMVGKLESNSGAAIGSQPPSMVNPFYGQYGGFVQQYGNGAAGIDNFAAQTLKANPNATVGDFYAGYVRGTGTPGAFTFQDLLDVNAGGQRGAEGAATNFINNAGVDPNTPLSDVISGHGTIAADGPVETSTGWNVTPPTVDQAFSGDLMSQTGQLEPTQSQSETDILSPTFMSGATLQPNTDPINTEIFTQDQFNPIDAAANTGTRPSIQQMAQSGALGTEAQTTSQVDANAIAGATSGTGKADIMGTGSGVDVKIGPQPGLTDLVKSTTQNIESAFGSMTQKILSSAVEAVTNYFGDIGNMFIRIGVIVLGIVLIAVAINKLMGGPTVVQIAQAARAA